MKNFLTDGNILEATAPSGGVTSGQPLKVGNLVGVCAKAAAQDEKVAVALCGVFSGLPKATGTAWNQGDVLYWDDTAKNFTKTSSSNTLAGFAYEGALSADAVGKVLLSH